MNHVTPIRHRILTAAGVVCAAAISLTGCANPVQNLIESASGSAGDAIVSELTGADVQGIGSSEIPDDFPRSVPLPDVTPQSALAQTVDGARSWIFHFEEGVNNQVFDALNAEILASGFSEETSSDMGGAMRIASYMNGEYQVNISLIGAADDDQILQMMIMESR